MTYRPGGGEGAGVSETRPHLFFIFIFRILLFFQRLNVTGGNRGGRGCGSMWRSGGDEWGMLGGLIRQTDTCGGESAGVSYDSYCSHLFLFLFLLS